MNSVCCAVLSVWIIKPRRYYVLNVETAKEARITRGKVDWIPSQNAARLR
jgi:hypothetical protein